MNDTFDFDKSWLLPEDTKAFPSSSAFLTELDLDHVVSPPTTTGADLPTTTKKKQDGAASAARLRSCSGCRLRRIKCEREPGQTDCTKCLEKKIRCVPMPPPDRKKLASRSGKRIEAARALFGDRDDGSESSLSNSTALTRIGGMESTSLENHLATSELQGAVVSTLIDFFLENSSQTHITLVSGTEFKNHFERAGRRIAALDDQSQVLYHVAIAIAARHTDSPLLVGKEAPRAIELGQATQIGMDLRAYGMARETACAALTEKALKMADEKATLRVPSVESITALLLIEGMIEQQDLSDSASRPYAAAYTSHTRALMEMEDRPTHIGEKMISGTVIGWTAYFRDAMTSAATGRSPTFGEDDLLLLREGKPKPPPLKTVFQRRLALPHESFWVFFDSYLNTMGTNATEAAKKLTGVIARRSPRLNEEFTEQYLETMALLKKAHFEIMDRLDIFKKWASEQTPNPMANNPLDFFSLLRGLRLSRCAQGFLILRVVGQRLAARPCELQGAKIVEIGEWPTIDGPGADDAAYWNRLMALQARCVMLAFESAREITQVLKETMDSGVQLGGASWQDGRGTQIMFSRLPIWSTHLLDMPVIEQGGQIADWTFGTKIDSLKVLLNAFYSVGWAFERLGKPAPWLKGEIQKLELAQAIFYSNTSSGAPTSTIPSTIPSSFSAPTDFQLDASAITAMFGNSVPAFDFSSVLPAGGTFTMEDPTVFVDFDFENLGDLSEYTNVDVNMDAAPMEKTEMDADFEAMLRSFGDGS